MTEERSDALHPSAPAEPDDLGELTDDAITGSFRILQRKYGHRYSLDDVLTAYEAAQAAPEARACLELGTGIGSVLLMLAHKLSSAHFHAVEAQTNSYRLLEQNVARNALSARVTLVHGDLREQVGRPPLVGPFDLVTGTPPYVPPGQATPSTDAQRAYARQEYRGGVEAYLSAAAKVIAPDGRVVVCADARFPERVVEHAHAAGLRLLRVLEAIPRADKKGPLFSVFTLKPRHDTDDASYEVSRFIARDAEGARSQAYLDLRAYFGLPPTY